MNRRWVMIAWLLSISSVYAQPMVKWPEWRGPQRDGVVRDAQPPAKWPEKLTPIWSIEVGEGHSSPIVVDRRIYQFARQDDQEIIRSIDLQSGKQLWMLKNPAPYEMNSAAKDHGKGPKSTPVYADGRVFTLGITGILSCVDANLGKLLWRKDFSKQFPSTSPLYGTSMSPIVVGEVVIAHVGGHDKGNLAAFNVRTGNIVWSASSEGPSYASPVLVGKDTIITQTQQHVIGFAVSNGKTLWKIPFTTGYDQNSVTPLVVGNTLYYSGYDKPFVAVQLNDTNPPTPLWSVKELPLYMSSPVYHAATGQIYGMTQRANRLFCIDAKRGKIVWESEERMGENAALLLVGDVLLVQTSSAKLYVVKTGTEDCTIIAKYTIADAQTWASPVFLGDSLLVKDFNKLTRWALK